MNNENIYIVLSQDKNFILPIYKAAFSNTVGIISKIKNRYLNAIFLDESKRVFKIFNVYEKNIVKKGFLGVFPGYFTVGFEYKVSELSFENFLEKLSDSATSNNSYSVWGQFYDSKADLKSAILNCKNFNQICEVLHISDSTSIADRFI